MRYRTCIRRLAVTSLMVAAQAASPSAPALMPTVSIAASTVISRTLAPQEPASDSSGGSTTPRGQEAREWFGRIVSQSSLEGIAGATVVVEPLPATGLYGDMQGAGIRSGTPAAETPAEAGNPSRTSVRTDADGRFALSAPAGVRLRLSAPGYLDGRVLLHAGRDPDLGRLVLRHELSLSGRVVRNGSGVAGVRVLATGYRSRDNPPPTVPRQTVSGAQGRFHIAGIYPEQFDELVLIDGATAVSVRFGSVLLDPRHYMLGDLTLADLHALSGSVVRADGEPATDVEVRVLESDSLRLPSREYEAAFDIPAPTSRTDATGRFTFMLPPGEHVLALFARREGNARIETAVPSAAGTVEIGPVPLPGGGIAGGRIVGPDGEPLAGVTVELASVSGWESVAYDDVSIATTTDANGCYLLTGLPLYGDFWLDAELPDFVPERIRAEGGSPTTAVQPGTPGTCEMLGETSLEPAGHLRGSVRDQAGRPVRGARLLPEHHLEPFSAHGIIPTPITTDDDGRFDLGPLRPGNYRVIVRSDRHRTSVVRNVAVEVGSVTRLPIVLDQLPDPVPLEVVAFDPRGAPEPQAAVRVSHNSGDGSIPPLPSRFTGADGRALYESVPIGVYSILAVAAGSRNTSYWQSPFRVNRESRVAVVEMARLRVPFTSLAGRLVDRDGNGVPRTRIHARGGLDRHADRRTISEADGSFRFDALPAGRYLLRADVDGVPGLIFEDPVTVPSTGIDELVLSVPALSTVTGSITGLRDDEVTDLELSATREIDHGAGISHWVSVPTEVDPDGTFRLGDLPPGEWTVTVDIGGTRSTSAELSLDGTGAPVHIEVELPAPSGFTLRGTVIWPDDPPEAAVAWADGMGVRNDPSAPIDEAGRFEIRDLPAGEYRISVSNTGLQGPPSTLIDVQGDTEMEFVVRGAAIGGQVVNADTGEPIPGAHVSLERQYDDDLIPVPGGNPGIYTDGDGAFAAGNFAAGTWRLELRAEGFATRAMILEVDDRAHDLTLPMHETPGLRLHFETPDGSIPEAIGLAWFSLDDRLGFQRMAFPESRDSMEFHWPDIGLTRGILYASTGDVRQRLAARMVITNDGDPVNVPLRGSGALYAYVPSLAEDERGVMTLYDPDGLPVTNSGGGLDWRNRRNGAFHASTLAAGVYRVVVTAADGRAWSGEAEIRPFESTEVVLR